MASKSEDYEEDFDLSSTHKSDSRWNKSENSCNFELPGSFDRFIKNRIDSDGGISNVSEELRQASCCIRKFPTDIEDQIQTLSEVYKQSSSYIVGVAIQHGIEYASYLSDKVHLKDKLMLLDDIKKLVRVSDIGDCNIYNGDVYHHISHKRRAFRLTETESDYLERVCRDFDVTKSDFIMWSLMSMLKKSEEITVRYQGAHRRVDEDWDKNSIDWFKKKKASIMATIKYTMDDIFSLYNKMYTDLLCKEKVDLESMEHLHRMIRLCRQFKLIRFDVRDYRKILSSKHENISKDQKRKTSNGESQTSNRYEEKEPDFEEGYYDSER
ncbi:MAG: hypothetical protein O8C67_04870 [Candidatus Methanoperedens sp.]|nr:hypothetical protein [Candidatus Methanoperedens sp.]